VRAQVSQRRRGCARTATPLGKRGRGCRPSPHTSAARGQPLHSASAGEVVGRHRTPRPRGGSHSTRQARARLSAVTAHLGRAGSATLLGERGRGCRPSPHASAARGQPLNLASAGQVAGHHRTPRPRADSHSTWQARARSPAITARLGRARTATPPLHLDKPPSANFARELRVVSGRGSALSYSIERKGQAGNPSFKHHNRPQLGR